MRPGTGTRAKEEGGGEKKAHARHCGGSRPPFGLSTPVVGVYLLVREAPWCGQEGCLGGNKRTSFQFTMLRVIPTRPLFRPVYAPSGGAPLRALAFFRSPLSFGPACSSSLRRAEPRSWAPRRHSVAALLRLARERKALALLVVPLRASRTALARKGNVALQLGRTAHLVLPGRRKSRPNATEEEEEEEVEFEEEVVVEEEVEALNDLANVALLGVDAGKHAFVVGGLTGAAKRLVQQAILDQRLDHAEVPQRVTKDRGSPPPPTPT